MDYMDRIREIRRKNGKTQTDMAALLKTTQQQYSKYENHANELPIHHLITICRYFHVSSDQILGIEENSSTPLEP